MTEQDDPLAPVEQSQPVALNTPHARAMLRKRYPAPEWALMEEVAPATGGGTRYADAIAVNLWSSRGHAIHGFEIKVSRSDWLRELKAPEKAEPLYRYCDHWWIVAPKGVVKDGELPPTWGLLELRATGLVQVMAAPRLEPQPITRSFFASLMRRGFERLDALADDRHRAALAEARESIDKRVAEQVERDVKWRTREHAALLNRVAEFEKASGVSLDRYAAPPAGIVRVASHLTKLDSYCAADGALGQLTKLADSLAKAAKTVNEAIAAYSKDPAEAVDGGNGERNAQLA